MVTAASKDIQESATAFLTVRENQMSWNQANVTSWLDQVKPLMTEEGYGRIASGIDPNGSPGNTWETAHAQGIATKVQVGKCFVNLASGVDTPTRKIIQCPVVDTPIDKDGKPLATTRIPSMWPYAGSRPNALLEMRKQGDKWYVHADWTGQAS
jgi:hypothetical protein